MIYLDTHTVVWLFAGLENKFSSPVKQMLQKGELFISPIVRLELQYLHEINRFTEPADFAINDLSERIGLLVCPKDINSIVSEALNISWTRDPFNRLIVANAIIGENILVSKDSNILRNYPHARW